MSIFTAYNRSFSSYNEAYQHCITCDFDPAHIVTSKPKYRLSRYNLMQYYIAARIREINLSKRLQTGHTYKLINPMYPNTFYIVSPSAKALNKIQCTYFYNDIPISDILRDTLKPIIEDLVSGGYNTIEEVI